MLRLKLIHVDKMIPRSCWLGYVYKRSSAYATVLPGNHIDEQQHRYYAIIAYSHRNHWFSLELYYTRATVTNTIISRYSLTDSLDPVDHFFYFIVYIPLFFATQLLSFVYTAPVDIGKTSVNCQWICNGCAVCYTILLCVHTSLYDFSEIKLSEKRELIVYGRALI